MIYTIGFTKTTAESFFERLRRNKIDVLIDIRLNNRSQLAGFAKAPDIEWFLQELCGICYIHDDLLAPTEEILKDYQKKSINWDGYVALFHDLMQRRNIRRYIKNHYSETSEKNICLLCSEPTAEMCHRRLVAEYFSEVFGMNVQHL